MSLAPDKELTAKVLRSLLKDRRRSIAGHRRRLDQARPRVPYRDEAHGRGMGICLGLHAHIARKFIGTWRLIGADGVKEYPFGDHPELLERSYHFDGDLLSLKTLDGTNREILWRRVPDRAQ